MSYRRRSLSRVRSSGRRSSGRQYRWTQLQPEPVNLPVGTTVVFPLLTPIQPPSTVADQLYQQMTMPTIIAVIGHVTIQDVSTFSCGTAIGGFSNFAWGLYKDTDSNTLSTSLAPWSFGQSNSWMMWHADQVNGVSTVQCAPGEGSIGFVTDLSYRRYNFTQRRYKRKMDSYSDSLIFAVENAPAGFSFDPIVVNAYFRILLLE